MGSEFRVSGLGILGFQVYVLSFSFGGGKGAGDMQRGRMPRGRQGGGGKQGGRGGLQSQRQEGQRGNNTRAKRGQSG